MTPLEFWSTAIAAFALGASATQLFYGKMLNDAYRWNEDKRERIAELQAELARLKANR